MNGAFVQHRKYNFRRVLKKWKTNTITKVSRKPGSLKKLGCEFPDWSNAMSLVRPRLKDHHGISVSQAEVDFAIPFLDEDIPLYLDPFLLWRSPSQQDQSLHTDMITCFDHLRWLVEKGCEGVAVDNLILV